MKRGLLGFPLLVFLIQFVSAQFFGGYGGFSITGFFNSIDSETMTLGLLFFIFFALIFYATSKVFKNPHGEPNKGVAGTISLAVSLLIVYGIYRSGFNIGNLFYGLGFSSDFIYVLLPIVILIVAILIIWGLGRKKDEFGRKSFSLKRGIGGFFILLGLLLVLLAAFTDIFYEKLTAIIIGFVLLIIGLLLSRRGGRKRPRYNDYGPSPRGPRMFGRMRERRSEIRDVKHQQRLGYEGQKAEEKYRRKDLAKTRKRRGEGYLKKAERQAYKEKARRPFAEQKAARKEEARRQEEIKKILVEEHDFSEERVEKQLEKLRELKEKKKQKGLNEWV
ncbi:hypothetical protein ES703_95575 [subsurface metagenome]